VHTWPGSDSLIHHRQASYVDSFNQFTSLGNKFDRILEWIDMDDEDRPAFMAVYVPDFDVCHWLVVLM
jgi:Type I phosphodiesterase / nucleotide pyrophosphatase